MQVPARDRLGAALLAAAMIALTWHDTGALCAGSEATYRSRDRWFESDMHLYFASMTGRTDAAQGWTRVHPLFAPVGRLPVAALTAVGVEPLTAVRATLSSTAGLWLALLFTTLRRLGCRPFDAVLFCVLAGASAAATFWFVVPETYGFGSLTILFALLVLVSEKKRKSVAWYVAMSAGTLSITVTNWMVGILTTLVAWPWRRALQITAGAFCLVVVVWGLAHAVLPGMQFFLQDRDTRRFVLHPRAGGPLAITRALMLDAMVLPEIGETTQRGNAQLTVQRSAAGSAGSAGSVAAASWIALLGLGVWSTARGVIPPAVRKALWASLAGQWGLHLVYGEETFLYTLHVLPLLVILVAASSLGRNRRLALGLAAALVIAATINNRAEFSRAVAWMGVHAAPDLRDRESTRDAILPE